MRLMDVRAVSECPYQQFLFAEAVTQGFLKQRSKARRGARLEVGIRSLPPVQPDYFFTAFFALVALVFSLVANCFTTGWLLGSEITLSSVAMASSNLP